ncbi:MAG: DUF362 domain-containing protein [Deltaproteobacteria bacterium]|nr:DUF362 domain-containing protein [Deltaproteobacteria bacterium]
MNSLVFVSRGINPYETTRLALQKYPLPNLRGQKVLIKPNAARLAFPGEGVTTHPGVVEATIDHLKGVGVNDILVGESCIFGVKAEEAFEMTGMKEICEKEKVKLIDFDQVDPVDLTIPGGKAIKKIKVPSILKEFDFIISIPVMKTHMHTQVTLSIKNMKGCLWRREKVRLHQLRCKKEITRGYKELDIAISEMATVLFPHFAIIDGTVGMEGMGPAYGKKKEMGIIVVGHNALSADAVASRLMGFDPEGVPHLKLSAEKGLGEIEIERISIKPRDSLKWESPFNPPPSRISIPFPDVIVHDEGSCSACLSTLLVFLQNYHSALDDHRLQDRKIHIGIGKHISRCPKGTILIGNCASKMKSEGIFVQGCPPIGSQILRTLGIFFQPPLGGVKSFS